MTPITLQRVVAVTDYLIVFIVRFALLVAIKAVEGGLVSSRVTKLTGSIVLSLEWEIVWEGSRLPRIGIMAPVAVMGIVRGHMIRCPLVIRLMARIAIRGD